MAEGRKIHIRIIGHSYIRRLGEYISENDRYANLQLEASKYFVDFQSRGGLTFQRLAQCAEFVNFPKPPQRCVLYRWVAMTCVGDSRIKC